jgi:hypothetical protein
MLFIAPPILVKVNFKRKITKWYYSGNVVPLARNAGIILDNSYLETGSPLIPPVIPA